MKSKVFKKYLILARVRFRKYIYRIAGWRVVGVVKIHTDKISPRAKLTTGLLVMCALVLTGWLVGKSNVLAQTVVFTKDDYLSGYSKFGEIQIGDKGTSIQLQNGVAGKWNSETNTDLQIPPSLIRGSSNLVYGPNDTVYSLTAFEGQCHFYRYEIERQSWTALYTPPVTCGSGTILVYDGKASFYYVPGGPSAEPSDRFFRYDIKTDRWSELPNVPAVVSNISDGVYVSQGSNEYVYIFRGMSSSSMLRYSIKQNAWESMSPFPTSGNVSEGITMAWDGANTIYAIANGSSGEHKKYDIVTGVWSSLTKIPGSIGRSRNSLQVSNGKIYVLRLEAWQERVNLVVYDIASGIWSSRADPQSSANVYDSSLPWAYDGSRYMYTYIAYEIYPVMYRYDTIDDTWNNSSLLSPAQSNSDYHLKPIYDGSRAIYYFGGRSNYDRLYKYDLDTRSEVQISTQINVHVGYDGVYKDGSLYVLPAYDGGTAFQRYDIATNTYNQLADLPRSAYRHGMDIVDGGDGYLYAIFGGGQSNFYRYNISLNNWQSLSSMPYGSSHDASMSRIGQKIYVMPGNSNTQLLSYDIGTAAWTTISSFPSGALNYGGFATGDGSRYLYIDLSNRTGVTARKMYRYDTVSSSWQRLADLPANTNIYSSAFYDTSANKLYVSPGSTNPLIWEWSPGTTSYATTGSWYSKSYDLNQVETWGSFDYSVSGVGSVQFETRSSSDGNIWTDWQQVSGSNINSPVNRYLQIKANLVGDGSSTPVVKDLKINHTKETSPPSLPSQFSALSKKGGSVLNSGQTYEHQHPYFSWSGTDDGANGSGVEGYYVYFGLNSSADPVVDGSYQIEQDYTVTAPMVAGEVYYLRLKVKDSLGNISPAATYFSYRYFYISPPGSIVKTSTADFSEGINVNVAIDNGTMELKPLATGAWSTGGITMPPEPTHGSSQEVVGDFLYVARGSNTNNFWRYNLVSNQWEWLSPVPSNISTGSSMVWDGLNTLYLIAGNGTNLFYRYNLDTNAWTSMPNLPAIAQGGTDLAYIGNNKIAIMFTGVREFYFYDITNNSYEFRQSYPSTITYGGSGIWFDGSDSVYAYFGGTNPWDYSGNSRALIAKYSISNDSWRALANPPVQAEYTQSNLVSDGRGGLYVFTSNQISDLDKRTRAMRYDIAKDSWSEAQGLEAQVFWGSASSDSKRYIYILPGANNTTPRYIIRYDTWEKKYLPSTKSIDVARRLTRDSGVNSWIWEGGNSSTATYDGNKYIYAIAGGEGWSRFVKFDHVTGETQYLPPPPLTGLGGSLGYLDGEIYYMTSRSLRNFYKFDQTLSHWVRMSDVPKTSYRPGPSNLVSVGNVFYAALGNNREYYKYTPDDSGGVWQRVADAPNNILNGSMVYNPAEDAIYVIAGGGSASFYRYDVAADTWSTKANLPASSSYGSTLVIQGNTIYAQRGNTSKNGYKYDIGTDTWSSLPDSPETFRYGSNMLKISDQYAIGIAGEDSPDIWKFVFPSATTAFEGQAIHTSQPFVSAGIFDYAGISAQVSLPEGTSVEFWTRSSNDGNNWSEWSIADNVKKYPNSISARVSSPPKVYTQVKLILQSDDNMYTPSVDSYSLHYYFDVDPPTNPTVVKVYSDSTKTTEADNNTWYNYHKPLVDWPDPGQAGGATDGPLGSNIAGYWVYFGTDNTASPRTAGTFVSETQYEASLTLSGNYYLRIQAQDITGNVDSNIYAPFVYKFDNQSPTNPSLVTVTPSGFTTQNNFTFEWPNAYDAHSGVAGYCYHTGATSGPFAAEICQPGKLLEDVSAAYRTGTNVFYVRAYDIAGNYSPYYTSASYYYTTDPPGPVTDLRAVPPVSAQNMFAFTWDLPVLFSGDPDLLVYCYSINILPSPLNTTCTSDQFISAFKAATQQGTNVLYVVAKDEAGNANWNDYASSNFIANTVSPGIPLNLVVSDTSDRVSSRWSLTSTWDKPTFEGNGIRNYVVERSEDGHTFVEIGNTSTRAFVDLDVTPEMTYYYRVRAADNVDNRGGASGIVARSAQGSFATPPKIVVQPQAKAGFDQARISWATSREATSFVYYGTSPSSLGQSKGSLGLVTDHEQTITGLLPSTTYYYRAQSFDNIRSYSLNDAYSPIYSFRTTEAARIYDVTVSDITTKSAVVSWKSSVPTRVRVEYGVTLGYGMVVDSESVGYSTAHSIKLSGLESGQNHHVRVLSTTEFGSQLSSDDYTFSTIAQPTIDTVRFQPINDEASAAVKVTWNTNVPTSSTVRYSALGDKLESSLSELTTSHEVILRDLASSTDYAITVEGRDQYGNLAMSTVQKWQSELDTRSPEVTNTNLSVTVTETSKGKRAQLIATWNTDEPSTSQVAFGGTDEKNLKSKSPLDTEPTSNHVVVISDLNLADIYKVQLISRDLNGNTAYSPTTTVVTPDKEENIFDSILNMMLRLFRL